MHTKFLKWILDMEEDDPLPYEINYIYFFLFDGGYAYAGSEQNQKFIINFDYFPLDAQYFKVKKSDYNILKLKLLVEDCMDDNNFKSYFKDKTISIGEFGQEILFSFS